MRSGPTTPKSREPNSPTPVPLPESPSAWQPLTPSGVARFATTSFDRLWYFQVGVALLSAGIAVWFLQTVFFSTLRDSIQSLPDEGNLVLGELQIPIRSIVPMAENPWLAFSLDLDQSIVSSPRRDLELRWSRTALQLCTQFGQRQIPYPLWNAPFNRVELTAGWDAWRPFVWALVALATFAGLMVTWVCLSTFYCAVPKIFAYFADRQLTFGGAWKMCAAGLLSGALLADAGMILFALGWIDLNRFLAVFTLHFLVPCVYIALSVLHLDLTSVRVEQKRNPFESTTEVPRTSNPSAAPERSAISAISKEVSASDSNLSEGSKARAQSNVLPSSEQSKLGVPASEAESHSAVAANPFAHATTPAASKSTAKSSNPFASGA